MSETTGDIWVQGSFYFGVGGAPGDVVYAAPTRLTALGSGWKKVTLVDFGRTGFLLHTDGTVKVCGNGSWAFTPGGSGGFTEYTTVATGVDDAWVINTNGWSIIYRVGTEYYFIGYPDGGVYWPTWFEPYDVPTLIPSLSGKDVTAITGFDSALFAVTANGELYCACDGPSQYNTGMSQEEWYTLGYNDGAFHRVLPGNSWAASTQGLGGYYDTGVVAIDGTGAVTIASDTSFFGQPFGSPPALMPGWPVMATQRNTWKKSGSDNGVFAYIGADGKLYAHYYDNAAPALVSPLDGWSGVLNDDDNGSGDVYVARAVGQTTTVQWITNLDATNESPIVFGGVSYEFPIYAVAGAIGTYGDTAIMLISGSEAPTGPPPPSFFWTVLVNTSETP